MSYKETNSWDGSDKNYIPKQPKIDHLPNPEKAQRLIDRFRKEEIEHDPVNHPQHYTDHPSGIECIQITEHMNFCLGNAMKYIWRADSKNGLEDLKKARWYINREIAKRENGDKERSYSTATPDV
jgi:hypothetical protein